jgi:hypothetical protein
VKCTLEPSTLDAHCGAVTRPSQTPVNTSYGFVRSTLSPVAPPEVTAASLAWDVYDHEAVLFGGTGTAELSDTTWAFHNGTWKNITDPAQAPPARYGAAMIFDNQSKEIVLYGGCGVLQCPLGDTWSFRGGTWSNITANTTSTWGGPTPTYDSSIASFTNSSVVLFGGCLTASCSAQTNLTEQLELGNSSCPGFATLAPCWSKWHAAGPSPPARAGAAAAFLPGNSYLANQVVVYGGFESLGVSPLRDLNDTWSFDGQAWNPVTTPPINLYPSAGRSFASLFYYDSPNLGGQLFLYGGYNHSSQAPTAEIWTLSVSNSSTGVFTGSWENYTPYTPEPPAQLQPAFTSIAPSGTADDYAALLVGDGSIGSGTSDTWVFETQIELKSTATPVPVETNATVTLSAGASGGTPPYSASWGFGDNHSGVGLSASHNYSVAGNYSATVQVTDAWGVQNSSSVMVPVRLPTINLTLPLAIDANFTTIFSATLLNGTPSIGPQKYNFTWSLPAHRPTPGAQISVIFSTPGPKLCSLEVTDATGTRVSLGFSVTVNPALVAAPTFSPSSPPSGSNVTFAPNVGGGTPPYTYYWAFGDGTSSNRSAPIHSFARTNTYTVQVWVNDSIGASVEHTFSVVVGKVSTPFVFDWSRSGWLIVAIVVVLAVFVVFMILGRRKPPPAAAPARPTKAPITSWTPPGGTAPTAPPPTVPGTPPPSA